MLILQNSVVVAVLSQSKQLITNLFRQTEFPV